MAEAMPYVNALPPGRRGIELCVDMRAVRQLQLTVKRPALRPLQPRGLARKRLIACAAVSAPADMAQDNAQMADRIRGAIWG